MVCPALHKQRDVVPHWPTDESSVVLSHHFDNRLGWQARILLSEAFDELFHDRLFAQLDHHRRFPFRSPVGQLVGVCSQRLSRQSLSPQSEYRLNCAWRTRTNHRRDVGSLAGGHRAWPRGCWPVAWLLGARSLWVARTPAGVARGPDVGAVGLHLSVPTEGIQRCGLGRYPPLRFQL